MRKYVLCLFCNGGQKTFVHASSNKHADAAAALRRRPQPSRRITFLLFVFDLTFWPAFVPTHQHRHTLTHTYIHKHNHVHIGNQTSGVSVFVMYARLHDSSKCQPCTIGRGRKGGHMPKNRMQMRCPRGRRCRRCAALSEPYSRISGVIELCKWTWFSN